MANETGLDFTEQIITLENKYRQAPEKIFTASHSDTTCEHWASSQPTYFP